MDKTEDGQTKERTHDPRTTSDRVPLIPLTLRVAELVDICESIVFIIKDWQFTGLCWSTSFSWPGERFGASILSTGESLGSAQYSNMRNVTSERPLLLISACLLL